ncbi:MAG: hypothetical protein HYZ43_04620 [Flavobacteriia bacterium]|nr:hypothetical protein [Flavobacteriia bacterium]
MKAKRVKILYRYNHLTNAPSSANDDDDGIIVSFSWGKCNKEIDLANKFPFFLLFTQDKMAFFSASRDVFSFPLIHELWRA